MNITERFSIEDFLAYFFPGVLGTLGLFLLLLLTPLQELFTHINKDLEALLIILGLALCYIIGNTLAGVSEMSFRYRKGNKRTAPIKSQIPAFSGLENEVIKAYRQFFHIEGNFEWTDTHYYICRSLVLEYVPHFSSLIQRQSGLRQLRLNLIPVFIIWIVVGVCWGIRITFSNDVLWGSILIVGSIVIGYSIIRTLLNRMNSHERREVREVLTAFIAGCHSGLFKKK
jgi:hypothetical protein